MDWTGHGLAFTFEALIVASVLYSLPFAVQPIAASFAQVDATLREASSTLGASSARTFVRITLPLSIEGVIAGLVLSFAHTVGEFGVVLMVGGNLPGVTRTVSIAIYDQVQALQYREANQTALVLLAFSFLTLVAVYGLRRKPWAVGADGMTLCCRHRHAPVAAVRARRRVHAPRQGSRSSSARPGRAKRRCCAPSPG